MFDKNEQIVVVCSIVIMVLFFLWRRRQRGELFNKPAFLYIRLAVIGLAIIILAIETIKAWNLIKIFALVAAIAMAFYIYKHYNASDDDDKGSND